MKRSKSSAKWLRDHENDEFVQRARREGYRSRASYKLLEIDDKFRLLSPGTRVVDLGAAPGGWTQVAAQRTGGQGRIVALDILPMEPVAGTVFIQGDFTEESVLDELIRVVGGPVDLVISDMAPNMSGMKAVDQPRQAYLVELAVDLVDKVLRPGGNLVVKCFEGEGIGDIREMFRSRFDKVSNVKPKASRGKSREIYLVGCGFRPI
ncbi:MAG: RlmE family RNA methyltransferase [Pseudomonadales bacterium]|nr:RlmE family RNA methyltransferase [Pseudomonadales bacterium]